jgi:aldose 1-epimerase
MRVLPSLLIVAAVACAAPEPASESAATPGPAPVSLTQRAEALPDGREVEVFELVSPSGLRVELLEVGAAISRIQAPDRDGTLADVVLGYESAARYLENPPYLGCVVGRVANRIAGASFELDGKTYELAANDGPNHLHGGPGGFCRLVWQGAPVESPDGAAVRFSYTSPDGEEGYPGNFEASVTYTLDREGGLRLDYAATTDAPTPVNLTNHSYFNLAGASSGVSILDQVLTIPAETYTPVDSTLIPTGEFRPVEGTAFDFRSATRIGDRIRGGSDEQLRFGRGYDHNWVVSQEPVEGLQTLARMEDPGSGRMMEVLSNQPGVQFYSGNFLDGTVTGKGGTIYRMGDALCLEPQIFPDTPNKPGFGSARLDPGEGYLNRMVFRFTVSD